MAEPTDQEIAAALQRVFKRCQTDMEFRQLCLTDPVAAIEQASGLRLPAGTSIRFTEQGSPIEAKADE